MPKGVLLGFLAFAAFSISDAFVKSLHGALPPYQLGFFSAAFSLLLVPFFWTRNTSVVDLVVARRPWLWAVRGVLAALATLASIICFTHLSMAEAFALIFIMPLAVTTLAVVFLKEKVTVGGWMAVAVGFAGVLVVLRPGFQAIGIGHIAALATGLISSVLSVLLRYVGPDEKPISLFGAGQLFPLVVFALLMIPGYVAPAPVQWIFIGLYAVMAGVGNMLLMFASRLAPASRIAPTQYSQMLWGILFGYVFFGDGIDLVTIAGIALIIGAGLWLFAPKRAAATP
jgi:S-adenosylmethionine uptake transporter